MRALAQLVNFHFDGDMGHEPATSREAKDGGLPKPADLALTDSRRKETIDA